MTLLRTHPVFSWSLIALASLATLATGTAAATHLGLLHAQVMHITGCGPLPNLPGNGRSTIEAHYACEGTVPGAFVHVSFPSFPDTSALVAREPWGKWVPVTHASSSRLGWTLATLLPAGFVALCLRGRRRAR
ncbi:MULTISPECIES: hypothetical protein [unclassified Streptomyces]|uniref:hypothetical protein n=1 Tax=unclassified Streptomyces TaxID=2593676 RepID=UPI000DD5D3BE|nr:MULTISPECIES: hypothetical protein [unclassified Streptomyces]QZZ28298.1 hypothetical protein A7X85_20305 [Streptomyces sp. ST1015]